MDPRAIHASHAGIFNDDLVTHRYLGVPSSGYGQQQQTIPNHPDDPASVYHVNGNNVMQQYQPQQQQQGFVIYPNVFSPVPISSAINVKENKEQEEGGVSAKVGGGRRGAKAVESKIRVRANDLTN